MRNQTISMAIAVAMAVAVQGCAHFNGALERKDNAASFREQLDTRTQAALGESSNVTLERCIAIALENNHKVRTADLEARIAKINRLASFSNFLPAVDMKYTSTELDNIPKTSMGPLSVAMQDRIVRETAVQAQMPVFAPATWFLYEANKRGEEIGGIAADYTRQMIALQISGLFFQCLALEESGKTLESQRAAAEALTKEVDAYLKEGLVTESQSLQTHTLLLARQTDCDKNARALDEAKAGLLEAMGLSPLAEIHPQKETPVTAPEGGLEDWILEALLNNPRLTIADRQVAIEKDKVKIAITQFLPVLGAFASRSHTSNSYMAFPNVTALGFSGMMSLFDGFNNVEEYRAARAGKEKAFVAREQESLAVMAEVYRAHLKLQDARADSTLADSALTASEAALREADARMREGLMNTSEVLDTTAQRDAACANATNARFQEQMSTAVLRNVVGDTFRGLNHEEQK